MPVGIPIDTPKGTLSAPSNPIAENAVKLAADKIKITKNTFLFFPFHILLINIYILNKYEYY